jgi:acetyl esterase/lipase
LLRRSLRTNLGVDTVLGPGTMPANLLYANGHDLADPYLSPLFGDFAAGFPPTLLAVRGAARCRR